MMHLYVLSGLGADQRVFHRMEWRGYTVTFVEWIKPHRNETWEQYSLRLCKQITTPYPILIGVSFGGMMAVEISKHLVHATIILISSAATRNEIPWYFRLAGTLRLHRLLPTAFFRQANALTFYIFGVHQKNDQQLLRTILKTTDADFLRWAIHRIVTWTNEQLPSNIRRIHGSRDRLLPMRNADVIIPQGGHLIVLNQAELVKQGIDRLVKSKTRS